MYHRMVAMLVEWDGQRFQFQPMTAQNWILWTNERHETQQCANHCWFKAWGTDTGHSSCIP